MFHDSQQGFNSLDLQRIVPATTSPVLDSMKAILVSMFLALVSLASMTQRASAAVPSPDPVVPVALDQSVVGLNGPWRFHIGDDPRWSAPDFDDSNWERYELAPGIQNLTPERALRLSGLPGWQHHGHPGYAGYAWYRIRLNIGPGSRSLALLMPQHVQDACEVYLNGRLIGRFGKLDGFRRSYHSQPEPFPIPDGVIDAGQANTLAIRFWSEPWEALPRRPNLYGGLRGLPLIGSYELLKIFRGSMGYDFPMALVLLVALNGAVGLISIFLFFFSGRKREYLWAGVALCSYALLLCAVVMGAPLAQISYQSSFAVQSIAGLALVFSIPLAAMYLLSVPRTAWKRANYLVSFLNLFRGVISLGVILGFFSSNAIVERVDAFLKITPSVLGCLLVLIAIDGLRTIGRKAWLLMSPGIIFGLYYVFFTFADPDFVRLPAKTVQFLILGYEYSSFGVAPSVLIIFLLRFAQQQRENGRLLEDMRQAREVQQFLIPEQMPQLSGWVIESEYRPAREVGGDFFQIIPAHQDGSLLIVAGDVTGKGLQAGMLVAMLVGAIRTESAHTSDPVEILGALNSRLHGREHAQATCLAIRIAADGHAILANGGHLPPYLNGEPIEIEGSLPLGMIDVAEFSVMQFDLKPNDRLVLVSDGIVEATNANGTLFGFDRLQSLLRTARGAGEVASAAQSFGQEDDITVIAVTHTGIPQLASASADEPPCGAT